MLVHEKVPYRVLNFLTSYINYGGRVTDYIDLRTIDVIMRTFYTPRVGKLDEVTVVVGGAKVRVWV